MKRIFTLLVLLMLTASLIRAQDTRVSIDLETTYQTIDNFGASDCWSMQKIGAWYIAQKEHVADLLFSVDKGIGLSAWRFNIGAGINRQTIHHDWRTVETFEVSQDVYDWTRQEEERWFLQAAKERGVEQLIAFVNSPPGRMTRNGYTNCTDGLGSTNLRPGYENQYAVYLADILKHFQDEWDIEFDYISPVNEPQWEWNNSSNQEGNRAANDDIKKIINALYTELQNYNLKTEISIIESGNLKSWYAIQNSISSKYGKTYGNYLSEIFADSEISFKVSKHLSGHSYWSDRLSGQLVEHRQELYAYFLPFFNNGYKYWMTEYAILDGPEGAGGRGRDLTMRTALDVARVIHYDLTILNASAWQWWTAVSPEDYKDGLIYTDYKDNPDVENIIESKILWVLGNYSRFIRPSSIRIKLEGADNKYGLMGSAYLNADRTKLIVVLVNMEDISNNILVEWTGLERKKYISQFTPYITSDKNGDNLKKYNAFNQGETFNIPARSVVTLIGEIEDSTKFDSPSENIHLFQNTPNPFQKDTRFKYFLKYPARVKVSIYTAQGQKIRTIIDDAKDSGIDWFNWDGRDRYNKKVSSGIYFCCLTANGHMDVRKIVLIH